MTTAITGLGAALVEAGDAAEAEAVVRARIEHTPTNSLYAVLGHALIEQAKYVDAEEALRECVRMRVELMPESWYLHNARSLLGEALTGQQRYEEAETLLCEAVEKIHPEPGLAFRRTEAIERVVKLYEAWGKPDEAAAWRKRR